MSFFLFSGQERVGRVKASGSCIPRFLVQRVLHKLARTMISTPRLFGLKPVSLLGHQPHPHCAPSFGRGRVQSRRDADLNLHVSNEVAPRASEAAQREQISAFVIKPASGVEHATIYMYISPCDYECSYLEHYTWLLVRFAGIRR